MKKTQKEIVLERMMKLGYIDNFYCIHNYILRLSDIIFRLRNEGMKIETKSGKELKKPKALHKNFYYILEKWNTLLKSPLPLNYP